MGRRIYVGNLLWSTTSSELQIMFAEHGGVRTAEVISDRYIVCDGQLTAG